MRRNIILIFTLLVFGLLLVSGCGLRNPSPQDLANADYGAYPSDIEEIVMNYLATHNFDPSFKTYFEIRQPKRYWVRSRQDSKIYYGYATKVILKNNDPTAITRNKEYFTFIRNGEVLFFEKWDFLRHQPDFYDTLINFKINTISDNFDGYTIYRMEDNQLGRSKNSGIGGIQLNVQQFIKGGRTLYSLIVSYFGDDWLFIDSGEKLILLVDGERMGFSGDGSEGHRDVVRGYRMVGVKEKAWYDISLEQLKKITFAKDVKVKVEGRTYFFTRFFTKTNFDTFRRFYKKYVKNTTG